MSLLTIGTMAFDDIETPFGKVEKVIGGACTYISWSASYFLEDIQVVSIVGDDFPNEEIDLLTSRGVNLDGLEIVPNQKSFFWSGRYHDNMNQRDTLVTELNVLADFDPILPDSYQEADFVMLGNLTPEIQLSVVKQLKKRPMLVAIDTMNFWMDVAWDALHETLKHVDMLIINDDEARQLSGKYSLVHAAEEIFKKGPKYLIVKKGEHGAFLFHEDKIFFAPAMPLAIVKDPTGAGDTFAGGFMGYIASQGKVSFEIMKTAIIYGSAMASYCVEEFSLDKLKNLSQYEISSRVQRFKELVDFVV